MINWWIMPGTAKKWARPRVSEGVGSGRESKRHERAHKSAIWPRATRNTLRYFRHFTNKADREAFAAQFVCERERRVAGLTKASRERVCVSECGCANRTCSKFGCCGWEKAQNFPTRLQPPGRNALCAVLSPSECGAAEKCLEAFLIPARTLLRNVNFTCVWVNAAEAFCFLWAYFPWCSLAQR